MASHPDTSAPVTTANGQNAARSRTSSIFLNRFSNASRFSVRTLPQYSVVDTLEEPQTSSLSEVATLTGNRELWDSPSGIQPPRYSLTSTRRASTATSFDVEGEPQGYEFRYSYPIRPKNPWATLHLHTVTPVAVPGTHSNSLQNQPRLPRFWTCDPITGSVQLDLDSPQNIQRISITLNGSIVFSSHTNGSLPFLKREFTIWDKSVGDPLQSDNTDSNSPVKLKSDQRLASGRYTFPFSFPFPTHADPVLNSNSISPFSPHTTGTTVPSPTSDLHPQNTEKTQRRWSRLFTSAPGQSPSKMSQSSDQPRTSFGSDPRRNFPSPIPQTFMEKDIEPNVAYDLSVRIVHGRFNTSSKIKTSVTCFPASEPLPASQKRRKAYEAGALLPCPMNDPEGWFALPTVTTYGMVKIDDDNSLHTRVDCMLYIAQPLSYTRGSLIPCFITIHSDGVEAAHLFPNMERPSVRLLRRVWHPVTELENPSAGHSSADTSPLNSSWAHVMVPTSVMNLVTHEVGRANWWIPPEDIVQGSNERRFEGEIHLSPDLQPSCGFQSFRIEYAVELLTFQTANFTPEVQPASPGKLRAEDNVMASNPVEITTLYRQDEPVPTAYSVAPTYYKRRVSSGKGAAILER